MIDYGPCKRHAVLMYNVSLVIFGKGFGVATPTGGVTNQINTDPKRLSTRRGGVAGTVRRKYIDFQSALAKRAFYPSAECLRADCFMRSTHTYKKVFRLSNG